MADFHISEAIIDHQRATNTCGDDVVDISRVEALWRVIEDENNSEMHLVSLSHAQYWERIRDEINKKLEVAETPEDKYDALRQVIPLVTGKRGTRRT